MRWWTPSGGGALGNTMVLITLMVGLAAVVYAVQMIVVQHPDYYYYKTLNGVLVVTVPVATAGAVLASDRLLVDATASRRQLGWLRASCGCLLPSGRSDQRLNGGLPGQQGVDRSATRSHDLFGPFRSRRRAQS